MEETPGTIPQSPGKAIRLSYSVDSIFFYGERGSSVGQQNSTAIKETRYALLWEKERNDGAKERSVSAVYIMLSDPQN